MAIMASTQTGVPGQGCQSPANNTTLLVTKANLTQDTLSNPLHTFINQSTKIRCTDEGIIKTIEQIYLSAGYTAPTTTTTISNLGLTIKRPNCECTTLTGAELNIVNVTLNNSLDVRTVVFSNNYSVDLGSLYRVMKIGLNGIEFVNIDSLAANDYVISCQSHGKTTDMSSGCTKIISVSASTTIPASTVYLNRPTTSWPQNEFSSSFIRSAIMLENGVYIFTIPTNGAY